MEAFAIIDSIEAEEEASVLKQEVRRLKKRLNEANRKIKQLTGDASSKSPAPSSSGAAPPPSPYSPYSPHLRNSKADSAESSKFCETLHQMASIKVDYLHISPTQRRQMEEFVNALSPYLLDTSNGEGEEAKTVEVKRKILHDEDSKKSDLAEAEEGEIEEDDMDAIPYDPMPPTVVESEAIRQAEYYFSDKNLNNDKFLKETIEKTKGHGWAPIKVIASFKKMRKISTDTSVITRAFTKSEKLEVSTDRSCVRRRTIKLQQGDPFKQKGSRVPSGEVTYFQTFCIDTVGVPNVAPLALRAGHVHENHVPRYTALNEVPLPLVADPRKISKSSDGTAKLNISNLIQSVYRCWNCGETRHTSAECDKLRFPNLIARNRQLCIKFGAFRGPRGANANVRYYEAKLDQTNDNDEEDHSSVQKEGGGGGGGVPMAGMKRSRSDSNQHNSHYQTTQRRRYTTEKSQNHHNYTSTPYFESRAFNPRRSSSVSNHYPPHLIAPYPDRSSSYSSSPANGSYPQNQSLSTHYSMQAYHSSQPAFSRSISGPPPMANSRSPHNESIHRTGTSRSIPPPPPQRGR
eukprot:jgi/Bigna1/146675/aug1.119_g21383